MSGHSKWSTIKRQKGAADIKRGMTFTKIGNALTVAARLGGTGDPNSNPRLRMALEQARSVNMPKENVQRAIDRGLGKLPGQVLEEVIYEGYGPGKVAFYLEAVTDNKLRTLQEIRNIFERSGGNLGGTGSTAFMFSKIGKIRVGSKGGLKDTEMLEIIDLGAGDVEEYEDGGQKYLVYINIPELNTMSNKLTQMGYSVEAAEVVMKPNVLAEVIDPEVAQKVVDFIEKLEVHDDIQKVYANIIFN